MGIKQSTGLKGGRTASILQDPDEVLPLVDLIDGEFLQRQGGQIGSANPGGTYTHPNHTGDVTSVADGAQTIAANAVTNTKAADMATKTLKGRTTAATGNPEDLTIAQARALIGLPPNYVDGAGLVFNTVSTVDILAGSVRDSTDVADIIWGATLTANIALAGGGSKANGLDADPATEAADTHYAVHVIADSTGVEPVASLLSLSATAPTLPAGYDVFRRVGWVRNIVSSDFLKFNQRGSGHDRRYTTDEVRGGLRVLNSGSAVVWTALDLSSLIPPTSELAIVSAHVETDTGGTRSVEFRRTGDTVTEGQAVRRLQTPRESVAGANDLQFAPVEMEIDSAQSLDYVQSNVGANADVYVVGFVDGI